ncbi:MAG: T9SS type A sorting domain-containing protein, partial [Chlamydiia bacterium]|nr:T9SS type A sorting domain-containing protein [Chlamydiia bacterium]
YFPGILADLAIDDSQLTESPVNIYPNPAYNTLHIETPEQSEIEIFNYLGQKVYQQDAKSDVEILDINSWKSGIYMIRIKTNQQIYTQKLIKK